MTIQKIALAPIKDKRHSEHPAHVLEEALVAPTTHSQQDAFALDELQMSPVGVSPNPKQLRREALAADVVHVQGEVWQTGLDPLQDVGYTTDVLQMRKEAFAALATHVHRAVPLDLVTPPEQKAAEPAVQKKKKGWLTTALRFGVTILIFAFLFKNLDIGKLGTTFWHIDPSIALVGLVVGIYTIVVSAYQWQSLLNAENIPLDLTKLINLYLVGIAFNHFLPTSMGGDAVKVYYVGREAGNMPGSASAAVMSRITGFFGMLLVAYPVLLIFHEHFTQQVVFLLLLLSLAVLGMVTGVFVFAALFSRFVQVKKIQVAIESLLPSFVRKKVKIGGVIGKAMDIGDTLVMSAKKPRSMIVATLFGVLFHVVACANYYSYGMALHMNVPFYFYMVAIPLVSLIGFLPVSIGGFGLREGALIFVFSTAHVAAATTLTLAFMMDVQMLFFAAIGGCMYLFMSNLLGMQKKPALT